MEFSPAMGGGVGMGIEILCGCGCGGTILRTRPAQLPSLGGLMAFWGYSDGVKHPGCIISLAATYRKVLGEKFDWLGVAMKQSKLKPINHGCKRSGTRAPSTVGCLEGTFHDSEQA